MTEQNDNLQEEQNKEKETDNSFSVGGFSDVDMNSGIKFSDIYIHYGQSGLPKRIVPQETRDFLIANGYGNNPLKQARKNKISANKIKESFRPYDSQTKKCDFCFENINGNDFVLIVDGRTKCNNCARSSLTEEKDYRLLLEDVKRNMENFFGISINGDIRIEIIDRSTLLKKAKRRLTPSNIKDHKVNSLVLWQKNHYLLYFEKDFPKNQTIKEAVYQLTHIWQHLNWDKKYINKKYGEIINELYDGMALWSVVQYFIMASDKEMAVKQDILMSGEKSARSNGYKRFKTAYLIKDQSVLENSPFKNIKEPLPMDYCGEIEGE